MKRQELNKWQSLLLLRAKQKESFHITACVVNWQKLFRHPSEMPAFASLQLFFLPYHSPTHLISSNKLFFCCRNIFLCESLFLSFVRALVITRG
jgi:hypothetical protein